VKRRLPVAVAIAVGTIVLLDFFFFHPYLDALGYIFVRWAVILGVFALFLGILNLLRVHFRRIRYNQGSFYSFVLITIMTVVIAFGLVGGPQQPVVTWIFRYVQFPLQASIFALLAFFIAAAIVRAFRFRNWESALLVITAVIVLLGQVPLGSYLWNGLPGLKSWILNVPVLAGNRGIIIGVALGAIATGLRLLMGVDRPYSE